MTTIRVPDIGDSSNVTVIEVAVKTGDTVAVGDTLLVLESDKASMEIPAEQAGVVGTVHLSEGAEVNEGDAICELETGAVESTTVAEPESSVEAPVSSTPEVAVAAAAASGATERVNVPDTGNADGVTVIEVSVSEGDQVSEGDTLIVLESDKASMEIPAPASGRVAALLVKEGQQVVEGDAICDLETSAASAGVVAAPVSAPASAAEAETPVAAQPSAPASAIESVVVPDTGNADGVTVIEVSVAVGDTVAEGDTLIVLESDKASMEIPSPVAGVIESLAVKEGDSVAQGDLIGSVKSSGGMAQPTSVAAVAPPAPSAPVETPQPASAPVKPVDSVSTQTSGLVHAGPAVRALARELGVDLAQVTGTGPRARITKDDLHGYIKAQLQKSQSGSVAAATGAGIPGIPAVDFAAFGPIERVPMTKIHKLTADNMTRCLLNVPAVTQFDEADITELEAFRKSMKGEADAKGVKLTPLPFLIKASAYALKALPQVNASIDPDASEIIRKGYVHIGIAVDTPDGLMVPVIRDADQKGLWELAAEAAELADKAKNKKLKPAEMQGATFTISSLGSIGGTAFTPIVPAPQAAILGVSKASMKPVWDGTGFEPRLMLPLCLSYDHRVINGGDGARFTALLGSVLGDLRRLLF